MDHAAFTMYLDALDASSVSSGTTAIDQAIKRSLQIFQDQKSKKTKLLIIITDGEDFSSDLSAIKQEAKQAGVTIFTLGVGTEQGARYTAPDAHGASIGHQKNSKGGVVISRLNEGILKTLADYRVVPDLTMTSDDP